MFFMREFLMYRGYFLIPLIKQINYMTQCYENNDKVFIELDTNLEYQVLNDCLLKKENCLRVCQRYRIGRFTSEFIGRLSNYKKIVDQIEYLVLNVTEEQTIDMPIKYDEKLNDDYIFKPDILIQNDKKQKYYVDADISTFKPFFKKGDGINLF